MIDLKKKPVIHILFFPNYLSLEGGDFEQEVQQYKT